MRATSILLFAFIACSLQAVSAYNCADVDMFKMFNTDASLTVPNLGLLSCSHSDIDPVEVLTYLFLLRHSCCIGDFASRYQDEIAASTFRHEEVGLFLKAQLHTRIDDPIVTCAVSGWHRCVNDSAVDDCRRKCDAIDWLSLSDVPTAAANLSDCYTACAPDLVTPSDLLCSHYASRFVTPSCPPDHVCRPVATYKGPASHCGCRMPAAGSIGVNYCQCTNCLLKMIERTNCTALAYVDTQFDATVIRQEVRRRPSFRSSLQASFIDDSGVDARLSLSVFCIVSCTICYASPRRSIKPWLGRGIALARQEKHLCLRLYSASPWFCLRRTCSHDDVPWATPPPYPACSQYIPRGGTERYSCPSY